MSAGAREPRRVWWTAEELAEAGLPDVPGTKRGVNMVVTRERWREQPDHARQRDGKGAGWEYHWTLLPLRAQRKLLAETAPAIEAAPRGKAEAWHAYDAASEAQKARAQKRLSILMTAEALELGGCTRDMAMSEAARMHGKSARSLWNWRTLIEGVPIEDRLAYLLSGHAAAPKRGPQVPCHPEVWAMLVGHYLRPAKPTFAQCYRAAKAWADANGLPIPPQRTAQRRLEAEIPRVYRIWKREGEAGLSRCFAPQIRDRSGMHALELVVADCHKIDIFVEWPDGTINRPQIVAFQDVYSGKIVSWRVDHDPNKVAVMAAFTELVETYGIPKGCYFDNGREFANKWMTGGTKTRFRFKIREDEPLGILPLLGVDVTWARPGHGQSKPVERTFRDLASDVAKDPRFDGAYVGHKPDAKPADYGSRAIPAELFLRVLAEGIAEHNARPNRTGSTAIGRSFDVVFKESYERSPIRLPNDEQRRLLLMGQEVRKLHKAHGRLSLHKNFYAAEWMAEHAGEEIVARFDAEDLHKGVWIYAKGGEFLGFAPCQQAVGFTDVTAAKETARREGQIRRVQKRLDKLVNPMPAAEVGKNMDETAAGRQPAEPLDPKVVSLPPKSRARLVEPPRPAGPVSDPAVEAKLAELRAELEVNDTSRHPAGAELHRLKPARATTRPEPAATRTEPTPRENFERARDIERRTSNGDEVGSSERDWHASYSQSAEYRAEARIEALRKGDAG